MKKSLQNKYSFITLLSSKNYLDAVLVLNESLKCTGSKYPFTVAVTDEIFDAEMEGILKGHDIRYEVIKTLSYSEKTKKSVKNTNASVLNTASKISLFDLKNYDKLVYIDADTIVMENIDNLFDFPDGSIIKEKSDDDYGFTGLFVFQPRYHREDFYKCLMQNFQCVDGDLLGSLWFYSRTSRNHWIPYSYCMQYDCVRDGLNLLEEPKVIHFCNENKPWLNKEYFKDENNKYINWYWELLDRITESKSKCHAVSSTNRYTWS